MAMFHVNLFYINNRVSQSLPMCCVLFATSVS